MMVTLDKIDSVILKKLLEDGRTPFSAIAKEAKLTDVAIKKRVEGLKRKGVIAGISADLDYKVLGFENPIWIQIRSDISKNRDLVKKLNNFDSLVELYHVLGEYNLLAKLIVNDLQSTEKVINKLGLLDGVLDFKTMVVLSELKKTATLPSTTLQKRL